LVSLPLKSLLQNLGESAAIDARNILIANLRNPVAEARAAAADGLSALADPAALEPLIDALHDPDPTVRFRIIWAIGAFWNDRVQSELEKWLNDPDPLIRAGVISIWGKVKGAIPFETLIRALEDDQLYVSAIAALAQPHDGRAVEPLCRVLKDNSKDRI